MAGFSDAGFSGLGGTTAGGGGTAGGAGGGMSGFGYAGLFSSVYGGLSSAFEFGHQVTHEIGVLRNNSEMTLAARDSAIRDVNVRKTIMAGKTLASAGKGGVTISGSVINAAANIHAKAAVDKYRIDIQARNQVALNEFREAELKRQKKVKLINASINAFVSTAGAAASGAGG